MTQPTAEPTFFSSPAELRAWLAKHHATAAELWVGYHKRATGRPSLTWPQSVDEALCFGWIDGVRKSLGPESYMIRFTPRRPESRWSAVNLRRMEALLAEGRVSEAGRAAYERRREEPGGGYSYEQRASARFSPEQEARFRAAATAWDYFAAQAPWYRRLATWWVMSARRPETQDRRLAQLIECCAAGRRLPGVDWQAKGKGETGGEAAPKGPARRRRSS